MTKRILVGVVVLAAIAAAIVSAQSKPSIQGVWRVKEATSTGPDAYTNKNPQPGLLIFSAKHYAMVRDTARQQRPAVKSIDGITAAEALATYTNFMAQAGTYEVGNGTVTLRAMVAKNPPPDGKYGKNFARYSMKFEGNTLTITQLENAEGKYANPSSIRLTRLE